MGIFGDVGRELRVWEGRGNEGKGRAKSSSRGRAGSADPSFCTEAPAFPSEWRVAGQLPCRAVSQALGRGGAPCPAAADSAGAHPAARMDRGGGVARAGPEGAWRERAGVGGAPRVGGAPLMWAGPSRVGWALLRPPLLPPPPPAARTEGAGGRCLRARGRGCGGPGCRASWRSCWARSW